MRLYRRKWTEDQLRQAVSSGRSVSEVLRLLGLIAAGGNYKTVKSDIQRLELNTSHWDPHLRAKESLAKRALSGSLAIPLDEVLVANSDYCTYHLGRRLLKTGVLPNRCAACEISEWRGKPLSLHLDHVNGDNKDHRLCNLRFLCPNCHSQTSTYAGRNKKRRREKDKV